MDWLLQKALEESSGRGLLGRMLGLFTTFWIYRFSDISAVASADLRTNQQLIRPKSQQVPTTLT